MKKQSAFFGAILSFISFGQPFSIKTGVVLSTAGLMFSVPGKLNAQSANFYFNRAYDKDEMGDYYGAIADYTKAIEINPQYENAYINRGIIKRKLKDYYGAISDYTKAIEINPNLYQAYGNRGILKKEIGDLKGACSDWRKTDSLSPNTPAAKWVRDQC